MREGKLGNIIEMKHKLCKNIDHGPFLIDDRLDTVECGSCGERLNAVYVLKVIMRYEDRMKHRIERLNFDAKKAEDKNRTKCEHCKTMTRITK